MTRPALVERARRALEADGIPYRAGLLIAEPPRIVFSVPRPRLDEARVALGELQPVESPDEAAPEPPAERPQPFPWSALGWLGGLFLVHLLLALWIQLAPDGYRLIEWGALRKGATALQPWRLVTSLLLHADVPHAFWNGVSMVVFGLPLLTSLGRNRTALIYLAAGIGGGITALAFAEHGRSTLGSSGAVAGLFGAWLVMTLTRARFAELVGRARIRIVGVALLFLPSLLSPISSTGHTVSVSSHLGGLTTGMLIGMLISRGLLARWIHAIREARRIE